MNGPVVRLLLFTQRKSRARWREIGRLRREVESLTARLEVANAAAARYRADVELALWMCPERDVAFEVLRTAHELSRATDPRGMG